MCVTSARREPSFLALVVVVWFSEVIYQPKVARSHLWWFVGKSFAKSQGHAQNQVVKRILLRPAAAVAIAANRSRFDGGIAAVFSALYAALVV